MTILLDTRNPFDAGLCGYDGPADPYNSTEGLVVELDTATLPASISLRGPNGEVDLVGLPEIREVAASLTHIAEILSRKGLEGEQTSLADSRASAAEARVAELQGERDALANRIVFDLEPRAIAAEARLSEALALLGELNRLGEGIATDLLTAHRGRAGGSRFMDSDDNDQRLDFAKLLRRAAQLTNGGGE